MNRLSRILKGMSDLIYPSRCFFCGENLSSARGRLCDFCLKRFETEGYFVCPACGKIASDCDCGGSYLKREMFPRVRLAAVYFYTSDPYFSPLEMARSMILRCKKTYSPDLVEHLARKLGFRLKELFERNGEAFDGWIVTYPPRNGENLLKYGFDHGELIAKALAEMLNLPCRKTLFRVSGVNQKELGAEERFANAADSLAVIRSAVASGEKYILVDDVITTGATMAAAADLLYRNGASAVLPAALAKTITKRSDRA